MKQYADAEQCYTEALAIYRGISEGETSVAVAQTLFEQGINYTDMEQHNNADKCYSEAFVLLREIAQGAATVDIAKTLHHQGNN